MLSPHRSFSLAAQIGESNHRAFVLTLSWAALVSLIVLEQSRRALGTGPCPTTLPAADGQGDGGPSPLASLLSKSTAAALASDTWMCETVGITHPGAGWTLLGWGVMVVCTVTLYVVDLVPSLGCEPEPVDSCHRR